MAKGGDKRRLEENRRHLNKLRALVAGANVSRRPGLGDGSCWTVGHPPQPAPEPAPLQVAFLVIRLLFRRSSAGKLLWAGWLLSGVICNVAYYMISQSLCELHALLRCARCCQGNAQPPGCIQLPPASLPTQCPPACLVASDSRHPPRHPPLAAPVYGPSGELVYSGQDLSVGGVLSYMHDVLYISLFVQLAGCATDWAWLTFLLVRAPPCLPTGRGKQRGLSCCSR